MENKLKIAIIKKTSYLLYSLLAIILVGCGGSGGKKDDTPPPVNNTFKSVLFESGQVRPLAISPDGNTLLAVNTPDNHLEVFQITTGGLVHLHSVPVGMEPVAVAARTDAEVWVVNHMSDSVSIVDLSAAVPSVVQTLLVGDEPRDIVFAGPGNNRAFISAAHRGQNTPFDSELTTAGVGRADVWVFDALNPGAALGGTPITIVNSFGDTLRALAVTPDGSRVYAAVLNSGNQTTTLKAEVANGGLTKSTPLDDANGLPAPETGLIVKLQGSDWVDNGDPVNAIPGQVWTNRVRFSLPDNDVFVIDANANPPVEIDAFSGVGTTLFNMIVNPDSGNVYVSNLEALNHVRFEGPGSRATTVNGHFVENRITVLDGSAINPRHLNKHITSYDQDLGTTAENQLSLATPLGMAITDDGNTLYVSAFGSSKVGIYDTVALEADSFLPDSNQQITISGGGPSGLALDEANKQLYVLTRFDNAISVINTDSKVEIQHLSLFSPEPQSVIDGRPFLYDASLTSSRGDSSCASCHIFGDMDHLAWDLGNPDEVLANSPNTYIPEHAQDADRSPSFHPMKGPMTTQSLRGLAGNGPMHWRGDRTGATKTDDETLEEQAFEDFNVAFVGLLGRASQLSDTQMQQFTDFALQLMYPPNPIRKLDNSLTANQANGRDTYLDDLTTGGGEFQCNDCHELDTREGRFGTNGLMSLEGPDIKEDFKIPHLRNLYQKVGMFGSTGDPGDGSTDMGDQIRGFGFLHDGSMDTIDQFLSFNVFEFDSEQAKDNVVDFLFAYASDLAPIIGQQVTLTPSNANDDAVLARIDLLQERALVTKPRNECDLIVKGVNQQGDMAGAVMLANGDFQPDSADDGPVDLAVIRSLVLATGNSATYTCVPPGLGERMGIDRDEDGVLNRDEP